MDSPVKKPLTSRRGMLKSLAAGAIAATLAPTILSDEKTPVLGTGAHTYEWVREWAKPPEGTEFGDTHGVQVDSQGRVLVHTNRSKDSVYIYDAAGKFIKSWGSEFRGGAHGFQLVKEGNAEFLYLATTGQKLVVKTTLDGEIVWKIEFGLPKEWAMYSTNYSPTNVAVADNGDIYIADGYGSSFVHQYSQKGNAKPEYVRSWGGGGNQPGKMSCPHGIFIDRRGKEPQIVVADRSNVRLQYFTMEGKFISMVKEELRHPCHFDEYKGDLLIPDLHGRVTLFDKDNKLITHLGDNPDPKKRSNNGLAKDQWVDGQFIAPHGACFDKDGNIFVAEWVKTGRVTKLKRVGA